MATQRRQITADEFWKLLELNILGEKTELLYGWIVSGAYPFAFSEEAVDAARAAGIELDDPQSGPGYRLASLGTPPAPSDDANELALAALIEHADADALARAAHTLSHAAAERRDSRLLAAAHQLREASEQRRAAARHEPDERGG